MNDAAAHGSLSRLDLLTAVDNSVDDVVDIASKLVAVPSENPPGDTRALTESIAAVLQSIDGVEVDIVCPEDPIVNIVARLCGDSPGRRLVFNGHLDTFPVGDRAHWSVDPLTPTIVDGKLYGRGVSDMKGGLACAIYAMKVLSDYRDYWSGELVLTFAGDEEVMGIRGTQYLLDHVPHAVGDAMICGDAGSPRVLRFGEKGLLWLDLEAVGKASHGAHVHLGDNAIESLMHAMMQLTKLRDHQPATPATVAEAMKQAESRSEALSGDGETEVLRTVTVNFGSISGGSAPNLVADHARVNVDIRIPVGVSLEELENEIARLLDSSPNIRYRITNRYEANWTDPTHEIVTTTAAACEDVLGEAPAVNMRVGASDARLYRRRGVPTVVCGPTPYGLGGSDEHVLTSELKSLAKVFVLSAFEYLQRPA